MVLLPGNILRSVSDGSVGFYCPGCKRGHMVRTKDAKGTGPVWQWDYNSVEPTFSPSIHVRGTRMTDKGEQTYLRWVKEGFPKPAPQFENAEMVCHSFVEKGVIRFLSDCTHDLAGKSVRLPNWEEAYV